MIDPSISCIVPVFMAERYLAEALDSILAQTLPPTEILVIDDGSTDRTGEIVKRYGGRVLYVFQKNGGPASARNTGLKRATGKFVAFLDQDDLWHPEKLERQMERFAAREDLDACITNVHLFWMNNMEHEQEGLRGHPRAGAVPGYTTPTLLAKRHAFDLVGPLDADLRFADATDWFLRASEMGIEIELVPDVLVYHRMHASNLTRDRKASCDEFLHVVKAALDRRRAPDSTPDRNTGCPPNPPDGVRET